MSSHLTHEARERAADAVTPRCNGGYLRIYDGAPPSSPDTPLGSQTLLAELRFGDPAFDDAIDGVADAMPLIPDASAAASGTATWFRAYEDDGLTPVFDGTVGTGLEDLVFPSVSFVLGMEITIGAFSYTQAP